MHRVEEILRWESQTPVFFKTVCLVLYSYSKVLQYYEEVLEQSSSDWTEERTVDNSFQCFFSGNTYCTMDTSKAIHIFWVRFVSFLLLIEQKWPCCVYSEPKLLTLARLWYSIITKLAYYSKCLWTTMQLAWLAKKWKSKNHAHYYNAAPKRQSTQQ